MDELIWRSDAIKAITSEPIDVHYPSWYVDKLKKVPPAQPDNDMIHLQKEQSYLQGWEEGREVEFRIGGRLFAIREKAQ